ncbi:MAG: DNA translocase FtsK [Caulobacteraceae bacterium]
MANAAARPRPKLTKLMLNGLRAGWGAMLSLRLRGAFAAVAGATMMASFATYRAADPSFNVSSADVVHNAMGPFGAVLADVFLQSLGLSAWIAAILLLVYGFRRAGCADPRTGRDDLNRRLAVGVLAVLLTASVLAAPNPPANWPLARGLGGFWGAGILGLLEKLAAGVDIPKPNLIATGLLALLAAPALAYAAGLKASDFSDFGAWIAGGGQGPVRAPLTVKTAAARSRAAPETLTDAPRAARKSARVRPPLSEEAGFDAPVPELTEPEYPPSIAPAPRTAPVMDDEDDAGPPFDLDKDLGAHAAIPISQPAVAGLKTPKTSAREIRESQKTLPLGDEPAFMLPELAMLDKPKPRDASVDEASLRQNARLLETVLSEFGVKGQIDQIRPGPVVTLYELVPAAGVKSSRVISLSDDIARSMSARACRVSVVPGRNAIGIELPNAKRETVYLRDLLSSPEYEKSTANVPMALGESIGGDPYIADMSKMPHLLIAGTTGSGKSVGVNAMILSILYRLTPAECRFIMIDPKMLELSVYDGIPHLLAPVVTDPKKAVVALKWTVREMENRYRLMSEIGVRNVGGYNDKAREAIAKGEHFERTVQTGFDDAGRPIYESEKLTPEPMPYLVVVIDEVADLMMVAGKDIEGAVQRLAQMARAAGIHLIMATQRPSVDVITGTIKANFPTRISFQVTSKIDARTILGEQGAEQLLGQGDMLYMAGGGRVTRLHGPFVSDKEVEDVATFLRDQGTPNYLDEVTAAPFDDDDVGPSGGEENSASGNDLYDQAVAVVTRDKKASTSYVQRRLQIGYNRAASLIERMEQEGVVGPANHAGKREIFAPPPPPL